MVRRRSMALAALLLGLLAVVALASRAHTPSGGSGTHRINGSLVLEYLTIAVLAVAAVALPLFGLALWKSRGRRRELPPRVKWMGRLLMTMTALALAGGIYAVYHATHRHHGTAATPNRPHGTLRPGGHGLPPGAARNRAEPQFDWVPAVVVFSAVLGGTFAAIVLYRRSRRGLGGPTDAELAEQLSLVLDDSLDDLRAEADPRRAVIAAYARMERVLALAGLPRHVAEAPLEYLTRVLQDLLRASAASVSRLTNLFEWAKFSRHEVDLGMKDEAIGALAAVRDELRAAAR